jgi:hypothetical protein
MNIGYQKKTTAEIKQQLTKHYRHKFSVTAGKGTASHWVGVRWIDGPSDEDVTYFCGSFNDSSRDDIMTDLWCGGQYTNTHREISIGAYIWAVRKICDDYGKPYPDVKISGDSAYVEGKNDYVMSNNGGYQYLSNYIHRLLHETHLSTIPENKKQYKVLEGSEFIKSPGSKYQCTTAMADMSIYRLNFNAAVLDFEQIKADFEKKEAEYLVSQAAEAQEMFGDDALEAYAYDI